MNKKTVLSIFSAVVMTIVALTGTFTALDNTGMATIITIFAGAFGSGASVTVAIYTYRNSSMERSK